MRETKVIMAVALALSGCSASRDKATAEAGVARFHQMLDAGRYQEIYAGAGPEFRQTGPEQEEIGTLQRIHDRLGAFRSSNQTGWRVNYGTGGNIVNLTYDAQFASAAGTEDFVFRINGNGSQLVGYHVHSPALNDAPAPAQAASDKPSEAAAPQSTVRLATPEPPKPAEPPPAGGK